MYHLALSVGFCLRGNPQVAWNRIHIPANSPLFSITGELFNGLVFLISAVWLGNALFAEASVTLHPVLFLLHSQSAAGKNNPLRRRSRCCE
jgi:hypothetical protein